MTQQQMWFGTTELMRWVPCPRQNAAMNPLSWGVDGTYLSGGGYVDNVPGSHKEYVFEWPSSSSREAAQMMKSYRDGTYGRGLIYFIDPLIYDKNILPALWADPSMGVASGARSLVRGVTPTSVATTNQSTHDLPVYSAVYDLTNTASGYRGEYESLFIPIPPGYTLTFGYQGSVTGSGCVAYRTQAADGTLGTATSLTPLATNAATVTNTTATSYGIRLWVGKTSSGAASVTLSGMTARLYLTGSTAPTSGPWIGGMGHSGAKFVGAPTYVAVNGLDGGKVQYAATFKEVGSWL